MVSPGLPPPVSWGWIFVGAYVVLSVLLFALSSATLMPSTLRAVRQKRAIRLRDAVKALQYSGEVVRKAPSPEGAVAPFGVAGRLVDLTVRGDDGTTVIATIPIVFDYRFPIGCRVVKRPGHLWPALADGPAQDPNNDREP